MEQLKIVTDPKEYFDMLTSDQILVTRVSFINEEMVELRWKFKEEFVETSKRTNVVIAAYTTTQARLKLYTYLECLGPRTLYCDTDSIVFTTNPGEVKPALGDLTDEVNGNDIIEFVTGGPKNYAYKLCDSTRNQTVCKVRGISLNYKNALQINYDLIKDMVVDGTQGVTIRENRITRCEKTLLTMEQKKDYRIVFDKRQKQRLTTFPYGF